MVKGTQEIRNRRKGVREGRAEALSGADFGTSGVGPLPSEARGIYRNRDPRSGLCGNVPPLHRNWRSLPAAGVVIAADRFAQLAEGVSK